MRINASNNGGSSLRFAMLVPLVFMIATIVSCCHSYSVAKLNLTEDLNDAMLTLANENRSLWTRQDTIIALRQLHEATHRPLIYRASDIDFRNSTLKSEAYFTLALLDKKNFTSKIKGNKIASDSIILVPEHAIDGLAIQVQGFADCSMASVFGACDKTVPGVLLTISIFSMTSMFVWRRKEILMPETKRSSVTHVVNPLNGIKLTPMQRQFVQMLLDAPDMKVDKATLCIRLWGNKINAEESLYTLVRRTKTALSDAKIEIICNRGESYELHM